jgi:group I intron endonuclease
MIGIYQITNKINNKIYIGQSVNIKERYAQHVRNSINKNTHTYNYPLSRAFRKYGSDNFELVVLEECSIDELTTKEQY